MPLGLVAVRVALAQVWENERSVRFNASVQLYAFGPDSVSERVWKVGWGCHLIIPGACPMRREF